MVLVPVLKILAALKKIVTLRTALDTSMPRLHDQQCHGLLSYTKEHAFALKTNKMTSQFSFHVTTFMFMSDYSMTVEIAFSPAVIYATTL